LKHVLEQDFFKFAAIFAPQFKRVTCCTQQQVQDVRGKVFRMITLVNQH